MELNKLSRILLLGANIWYFGEGMLGPLLAIFTEKVGGDILDITWAWAVFLIVTGVCYILTGRYINNKPYKAQVMVLGYALNAVFTFCYLGVSNPFQLFLVQAGLGVAEAISTPTWDTLFAKTLDEKNNGYAWGLAGGQSQIVTGIAVLIGGTLVYYLSFQTLFLTMGIFQVIATLVQSRILFAEKKLAIKVE